MIDYGFRVVGNYLLFNTVCKIPKNLPILFPVEIYIL